MSLVRWWTGLLADLEKPPSGPVFSWSWVAVPVLLTALLTAFSIFTGFDLGAQQLIYRVGNDSWQLGQHPFWRWLYLYGTLPAGAIFLVSISGYLLSWRLVAYRKWRRVFLYAFLAGLIGPGVLVNAVLKEHSGRPRPREVEGMGGHFPFQQVLEVERESDGKSFPCGHATMGFYFVAFFFLFRRHRRELARGMLLFGLATGFFMGVARMLQGGHFFSDVVWAGTLCYFASMGLFYAMGLHRGLVREESRFGKLPLKLKLVVGAVAAAAGAAILVASPYQQVRRNFITEEFARSGPLQVLLRFELGDVEIRGDEDFRIEGEAYGHGIPTSGIRSNFVQVQGEEHSSLWYTERRSGWFSEINQQLEVELPWSRVQALDLEPGEASVKVSLGETQMSPLLRLSNGSGEVVVVAGHRPVIWSGGAKANVESGAATDGSNTAGEVYRIEVADSFTGRLLIEGRDDGTTRSASEGEPD